MSIELVMPSNHLILCQPLLLLPLIFPSLRIFYNEVALHIRWPKYWSFSFSISPSNEYSGLISFRMDWFDLLAVQETKASILQHSAFCIVQLSHPYMTTAKTTALTRWTFVGKVMTLLFNMLSRLVALGWCPLNVGKANRRKETWKRRLVGSGVRRLGSDPRSDTHCWDCVPPPYL